MQCALEFEGGCAVAELDVCAGVLSDEVGCEGGVSWILVDLVSARLFFSLPRTSKRSYSSELSLSKSSAAYGSVGLVI